MKRSDLIPGIESLNMAYKEVTDQLVMEDPAMNQRILDLIRIWWDVLGDDFTFADAQIQSILEGQKAVDDHRETIEYLSQSIRASDSGNIELWSAKLFGTLRTYAGRLEKTTTERSRNTRGEEKYASAQNDRRTVNLLQARLEQVDLSHNLRVANRLAKIAVQEAQTAATDARNAAGFASTSTLTEQFNTLETNEAGSAKNFRGWTIATVIAAVLLSFFLGPNDDAETGQALFRIALLAGVLGLATYLGRQAAYHRNLSTWAGTIKVQLLTFDAYISSVHNEDLEGQMRVAFATRVFGSSPDSKDDGSPTMYGPMGDLINQFARGGSKP